MSSSPNLAVVPAPEPPPQPQFSGQVQRAARALIGWMKADDAHRVMAGSRHEQVPSVASIEAAQQARAAVASRGDGVDQEDLVKERPASLEAHVAALRVTSEGTQMFNEGWDVAMVDLAKVCGFQPLIFSDQAADRVDGVDPSDVSALARVTLPISPPVELPVQFDPIQKVWVLSSANPNLRVLGQFAGPSSPGGPPVFGFAIGMATSYLQVGRYRGRYFLRDGYHRAFGFLSRGITEVPAFVRDISVFEELVPDPRVMLPQDGYRGPRPPVLPDYLDESVSAGVVQPVVHKMIVIQAMELTPLG